LLGDWATGSRELVVSPVRDTRGEHRRSVLCLSVSSPVNKDTCIAIAGVGARRQVRGGVLSPKHPAHLDGSQACPECSCGATRLRQPRRGKHLKQFRPGARLPRVLWRREAKGRGRTGDVPLLLSEAGRTFLGSRARRTES